MVAVGAADLVHAVDEFFAIVNPFERSDGLGLHDREEGVDVGAKGELRRAAARATGADDAGKAGRIQKSHARQSSSFVFGA